MDAMDSPIEEQLVVVDLPRGHECCVPRLLHVLHEEERADEGPQNHQPHDAADDADENRLVGLLLLSCCELAVRLHLGTALGKVPGRKKRKEEG